MKQRLLKATALLLLMFSCSASIAQIRYTSAVHHSTIPGIQNGYGCPVRYWKNDMSVAFVKQSPSTSAFCLIDHSDFNTTHPTAPPPAPNASVIAANTTTPIIGTPIANDFTVNDIYIADDYAFFCGTYYDINNERKSCYGYFDLNDLLGTSATITVSTLTIGTPSAPVTLSKLVAYRDGTSYRVVAIGNEEISYVDGHRMVVEIPNVFSSPATCSMAVMPVSPPPVYSGNKLYVDDIILTSSYVVLLGHDIKTTSLVSGYPWFAVCQKTSVVSDVLSASHNYYLPNLAEANNTVEGVTLYDDVFAMSYVHCENNIDYTRLRVIDLPTLQNTRSQQFKKPQKEDPTEMIYLKDLKSIELLQCVQDSSNFIQLFPSAPSGYYASALTADNREYKSLSPIDGERFISMRSGVVFLEDRTVSLPHSTPSCPGNNIIPVSLIRKLPPKQYPSTGTLGLVNINHNLAIIALVSPPVTTNCNSYE